MQAKWEGRTEDFDQDSPVTVEVTHLEKVLPQLLLDF